MELPYDFCYTIIMNIVPTGTERNFLCKSERNTSVTEATDTVSVHCHR